MPSTSPPLTRETRNGIHACGVASGSDTGGTSPGMPGPRSLWPSVTRSGGSCAVLVGGHGYWRVSQQPRPVPCPTCNRHSGTVAQSPCCPRKLGAGQVPIRLSAAPVCPLFQIPSKDDPKQLPDPFNDLSVGGWEITEEPAGRLSVWAVSLQGKVRADTGSSRQGQEEPGCRSSPGLHTVPLLWLLSSGPGVHGSGPQDLHLDLPVLFPAPGMPAGTRPGLPTNPLWLGRQ